MVKNLVIVESPAKARTVGRFLGDDYDVKASMGHVRDLPKRSLGIVIDESGFQPTYKVSSDKRKIVSELRKAAAEAEIVYLATDPDREGEAISWHLVEAAEIDVRKTRRVVFHEITEAAINEAFTDTRNIDIDLVDAQQARRVLDRLVGYRLSPVLWRKVKKGTSAGRVQSAALKMVVDREKSRQIFQSEEYWTLDVTLGQEGNGKSFTASLHSVEGEKGKIEIPDEARATSIREDVSGVAFQVSKYGTKESIRRPSAPFITSTLQQEASRRLRFSASRTMTIAQQLYEGIQLGSEGQIGLITYMRTDSTNISALALSKTADYIKREFKAEYSLKNPRRFTKTVRGAQEAHEAIRPTDVDKTPESLRGQLERDQFRLYDLIWKRMVSSQMANAIYDRTTIEVGASGTHSGAEYLFKATGSVQKFDGFRALYTEQKDDDDDEDANESRLPILKKGDELKCVSVDTDQHFTEPPPRFSEASLIKSLESEGIGRPSTYASIIGTIQDRDYVRRERGRFHPTKLGTVVTDFLSEHFSNIVDIGFTATIEKDLDDVAEGTMQWNPMLRHFYQPFDEAVEVAIVEAERVPREKIDEESNEVCEKCERPMVIRGGRNGRFIACTGFPDCRNTKPLTIGIPCPRCEDGQIAEKKGKRGIFFSCTTYPGCDFSLRSKPLPYHCPVCEELLLPSGSTKTRCSARDCGYRGDIDDLEKN